jgi:O-antigen/teichoic acid export membrane protein
MKIIVLMKNIIGGDVRSIQLKKNIIGSVFVKGCSILTSFILVPLTLEYLTVYEYGIWLTLSSVLMWINYFDIGLGNGLRNKLAEALALDDKELARIYISTAMFMLIIIVFVIYLLFIIIQLSIDWYKILNVPRDMIVGLNNLVPTIFLFFCLSFILKIIGNIYLASQLSVVNDLLNLCGNVLSLVAIFILTKISNGGLSTVAIIYSCAPIIVYIIAYFITFYYKFPFLRPKLSAIKIKYAKYLMGLGIQFFIIQISGLILFSSSNILITHLFGPEYVAIYNIAFKYFSVITMAFHIVIAPVWSAITNAHVKNDYSWIKKTIKNLNSIWLALFILTLLMVVLSNLIYKIWIGRKIEIPMSLSILMGVYVTMFNWNNIYSYFLNGIGKIKIQLYISISAGLFFIPLAIFLSKFFGLTGIISSMCIVMIHGSIITPIVYKKIISGI